MEKKTRTYAEHIWKDDKYFATATRESDGTIGKVTLWKNVEGEMGPYIEHIPRDKLAFLAETHADILEEEDVR